MYIMIYISYGSVLVSFFCTTFQYVDLLICIAFKRRHYIRYEYYIQIYDKFISRRALSSVWWVHMWTAFIEDKLLLKIELVSIPTHLPSKLSSLLFISSTDRKYSVLRLLSDAVIPILKKHRYR